MKKNKFINICLITLCIFIFNVLDVRAQEYAYCYYNYEGLFYQRKDTGAILDKSENGAIAFQIAYNSDNRKNPTMMGRFILKGKYDFSNGYDELGSEFKDFKTISCSNIDKFCFEAVPTVNVSQLRNSNFNLVCPTLYLYKSSLSTNKYKISLVKIDVSKNQTEKYVEVASIPYDSAYSKIKNDSSVAEQEKDNKKCSYPFNNARLTAFITGTGNIEFYIQSDGTVNQITSTGDFSPYKFGWDGEKISTCPSYLDFVDQAFGNYDVLFHPAINGDKSDTEIEESTGKIVYVAYSHTTSNKKIEITNNGNAYVATYGNTQINISSLSQYTSSLNNGKYPKYIIKDSNDNYSFADTMPKDTDYQVWINSKYLNEMLSITCDDTDDKSKCVEATCESIFGNEFMNFINNNVLKIVYIGVPIILLALTTFDFAKVVFVDDKDGIKKASGRFGKRVIAAILIYLLPQMFILVANTLGSGDVQQCVQYLSNLNQSSE